MAGRDSVLNDPFFDRMNQLIANQRNIEGGRRQQQQLDMARQQEEERRRQATLMREAAQQSAPEALQPWARTDAGAQAIAQDSIQQGLARPFSMEGLQTVGVGQNRAKQFSDLTPQEQTRMYPDLMKSIRDEKAAALAMQKAEQKAVASKSDVKGPQAKAAKYYFRTKEANALLDDAIAKGYNTDSLMAQLSGSDKVTFSMLQQIQDPVARQFAVAAANMVTPELRDESGAAIATSEFIKKVGEIIPGANESGATAAAKNKFRAQTIAGFKTAAGDQAISEFEKNLQEEMGSYKSRATKKVDPDAGKNAVEAVKAMSAADKQAAISEAEAVLQSGKIGPKAAAQLQERINQLKGAK